MRVLLPERPRPLIFAHRGCSSLAPENTMAAFRKARDAGAPGLELDIHATKDGGLVVAHDDTFERTAPQCGSKQLEELTVREIKHFDVGSFFDPAFAAERPPLLEEVFEEFCPDLYIDIELKSHRTKNDPLPQLLAERLKALGPKAAESVTVSSFNPVCLRSFKTAWKRLRNTPIACAVIYCASAEVPFPLRHGAGRFIAGCDYLKPRYTQVNVWRRALCALEGRPLVPWTVDDGALARRLFHLGCAGIITNRPQDIVER
ncbi:MAG: glycerophosphodiester phosphodiesterase [Treponema sp.]|jgi:glycerophosphoryl diester phosphodiesterase|nr:glycerophosphodiester phosphodiesterase [Treponema sp.]